MLKLEKIAKSREIVIELRENQGFLNRPLVQAFAIALGLHLFAGILFEVRPFIILGSQQVLPPIEVEADATPILQGTIIALLDKDEALPRAIPPPNRAVPATPNYALADVRGGPVEPVSPLFTALEDRLEVINFGDRTKSTSAVEVRVAGLLAERPMIAALDGGAPSIRESSRAVYSVRVDEKSGSIFWYEEIEPAYDKKLRAYADLLLRSLRFQGDPSAIVTAGEIEIHFHGGAG